MTGLEIACWRGSTSSGCFVVVELGGSVGIGVEEVSFGTPFILTPCLFFAILEDFEDMMGSCSERQEENKDFKITKV